MCGRKLTIGRLLFQGVCAADSTVIAEVQCQCAFDYVATCDRDVGQADVDVYNQWRIDQNRLRKYCGFAV